MRLHDRESRAVLSDGAADVTQHNAVSVEVYPSGAGASADVSIEGSSERGGNYGPLTDPNAAQTGITSAQIVDVLCGSAWVKARLANVTGVCTVIVTPYIAPGPTTLVATVS